MGQIDGYGSKPGGLEGIEIFIFASTTETYNCTLNEISDFIKSKWGVATAENDGYLSKEDWVSFNSKSTLALGTSSTTAYRGDYGNTAYSHSQTAHAPSDAEKNVQADWNEANTESDAYIQNKPTIPDITGMMTETSHSNTDHTGLTGVPSIAGLLDETAHDLLDHTGLTGVPAANYDCTVGTGGTYSTVKAAVDAGKENILIISNVTETASIALTKNIIISYLTSSLVWTLAQYNITGNYTLNISKGNFLISGNNNEACIQSAVTAVSMIFTNNGTINGRRFFTGGFIGATPLFQDISKSRIVCSNYTYSVAYNGTGSANNYCRFSEIDLIGGGSSCGNAFVIGGTTGTANEVTMDNIRNFGTFASSIVYYIGGANFINSNISVTAFLIRCCLVNFRTTATATVGGNGTYDFSAVNFYIKTFVNGYGNTYAQYANGYIIDAVTMSAPYSNMYFTNVVFVGNLSITAADGVCFTNCVFVGTVATSSTAANIMFNNCIAKSTVTIATDNNQWIGGSVTGAFTLSSGAEYNRITGAKLTGGLTNSSGNNTNEINNNI